MAAFTATPVRPPLATIVTTTLPTVAALPSTVSLANTMTMPPEVDSETLSGLATGTGGDTVRLSTAFAHTIGAAALHNW